MPRKRIEVSDVESQDEGLESSSSTTSVDTPHRPSRRSHSYQVLNNRDINTPAEKWFLKNHVLLAFIIVLLLG